MIRNIANTLNMKDLEITNEWIDRYNENDLTEDEKVLFRKRMEKNPLLRTEVHIDACLNKLYQDDGTLDLMKKIKNINKKTDRDEGLWSMLIAASFLYLIAFGTMVSLVRIDPGNLALNLNLRSVENRLVPNAKIFPIDIFEGLNQVKSITPDARRENSRKQQLALNYKPLDDFELLVGCVTRSAHLSLIAPSSILTRPSGSSVEFKWVCQGMKTPVNITFFNNRGKLVFEANEKEGESYTLVTQDWPGGVYYWKIIMEEEMIFMGKLILL